MKKNKGLPVLLEKRKNSNLVRLILTVFAFVFAVTLSAQFDDGQGTEDDPFIISTHEHLNNIKLTDDDGNYRYLNYHYRQTADIIFTEDMFADGGIYHNDGEGWVPIGPGIYDDDGWNDEESHPFTGSYDGNGHIIDGLFINRPNTHVQALFGFTENATITNLGVTNVDITGDGWTAGLGASVQNQTTVKNCYVTGNVDGGWVNAGLLIGHLRNGGYVENCYTIGSVVATRGENNRTGGFAGFVTGESIVTNSYSRADVTGRSHCGGFVGETRRDDTFINCYSTGSVNGDYIGGFSASRHFPCTYINCYWNTETSGTNRSDGGSGKTTMQMIYPEYLDEPDVYVDWDFDSGEAWAHDVTREINDGYPILFFQDVPRIAAPEVNVETVLIGEQEHIRLNWEAVEDAVSYRIYASEYPDVEDWGDPITVTEETEYTAALPVNDNMTLFYYVTASAE